MKKNNVFRFYYFLASLNVITILTLVFISSKIYQTYDELQSENIFWMNQMERFSVIKKLVIKVNDPGNSIFLSNNVEIEREKFIRRSMELRSELSQLIKNPSVYWKNVPSSHFMEMEKNILMGEKHSLEAFKFISQRDLKSAAIHMSEMDNSYRLVLNKILEVRDLLLDEHKVKLNNSQQKAFLLFKKELIIAVIVLLVILFTFYLGGKIKKKIDLKEVEIYERSVELERVEHALNQHSIIARTDANGIIRFVNDKFCEVSGYSREELLGKTHSLLNSGYHPVVFFKHMWKTILSGKKWRGQVKNKTKSGNYYWVDTTITPIVDGQGNVVELIAIRNEITEQKNQEMALIDAKNAALSAEKGKAEFLANMSHEIRTPMNGVLGMLQLLSETNLTKEQREMLEMARSCGDGLLTILNDILDLSKIDSGKLELEIINFSLDKCIEEALYLNSYRATNKGLNLIYRNNKNEENWFMGDLTRIRQIIVNFISNAVKFTDSGEVAVTVESSRVNDAECMVAIKVKDTGIGISEENKDKLFKAFSQTDSSTTRKFGGTGLGLSICYKLAQLMNGEVFVESKLSEGSTFGVIIPLKFGLKEEANKIAGVTDITFLPIDIDHKILVVEDNSVNQRLIVMMLKKLGFECDLAGNGLEALDALNNLHSLGGRMYSIIFMDMQMPEMDGIEATKRIVEIYGDNRPPIIALTANAFKEDQERCLGAGMNDFISKPLKVDDLRRILTKFSIEMNEKIA